MKVRITLIKIYLFIVLYCVNWILIALIYMSIYNLAMDDEYEIGLGESALSTYILFIQVCVGWVSPVIFLSNKQVNDFIAKI